MTPEQKQALIDLLWGSMRKDREHPDRVQTAWGTKTKDGLIACIERIVKGDLPR